MDVSGEVQKIQDKAEAEWTDEVKEKWSEKVEADKVKEAQKEQE